jgi:hypothetical protein
MKGSNCEGEQQEVEVGVSKDAFDLICVFLREACKNRHSPHQQQVYSMQYKPYRITVFSKQPPPGMKKKSPY